MSDYDDDYGQNDGPKALRDLVEKLQKQVKDLEKGLDAEKAEKATLAAQVKKSSLADLLKAAGIDPKFAARADKDGAEPTADGVKAWVEENKDFYNFAAAKPAETVAEQAEPDGEPNIPAGLAAGVRADQVLSESGVAPSDVDITSRIRSISANTEDALLAELAAAGVVINSGY